MSDVVPVDFGRFSREPPRTDEGRRLRRILLATNRYDLGTWWEARGFGDGELDIGGTTADEVRPAAAVAVGLAVSLASGAYAPGRVGVPTERAWDRTTRLVSALVGSHRAVRGKAGWGDGWQTALWAAYAGLAAWLVWNALDGGARDGVGAMVAAEADRLLDVDVPYFRDASGEVRSPGDSKAEENSWNGRLLDLAVAMLPGHERAGAWREKSLRFLISAYARHDDVTSDERLHGRPLSAWLDGSNVQDNGVVINHHRVHPDYMVVPHNAAAALHAGLRGRPVPAGALHGLDVVYRALVDLDFDSPPYDPPGGTVYRDGSPDIYYPSGSDWGTRRRVNFVLNDVQAAVLGFDRGASTAASEWERLHAEEVLAMVARFDDGRVYGAREEFDSDQREEEAAEKAGQAYLTRWLAAPQVTRRPLT